MATPVDPILTTIERYRIAYVAFASLHKTDGRKAGLEKGREVTQTDEDATKRPALAWGMLLVNRGMTAFGVRARGAVLPLAEPIA
jgi:hypothetical protein